MTSCAIRCLPWPALSCLSLLLLVVAALLFLSGPFLAVCVCSLLRASSIGPIALPLVYSTGRGPALFKVSCESPVHRGGGTRQPLGPAQGKRQRQGREAPGRAAGEGRQDRARYLLPQILQWRYLSWGSNGCCHRCLVVTAVSVLVHFRRGWRGKARRLAASCLPTFLCFLWKEAPQQQNPRS